MNIIKLDSVDSTNKYARENFLEWNVYWTTNQTEGKGTRGRQWIENEGSVAISICLPSSENAAIIPMKLALALTDVADGTFIKWPNDIVDKDMKKIAGILTENFDGKIVVGIGVNLNNSVFPDEIKDKATSLKALTGSNFDVDGFVSKLVEIFKTEFNSDQMDKINQKQILKGNTVFAAGKQYEFVGVNKNGECELSGDETVFYHANDLSLTNEY